MNLTQYALMINRTTGLCQTAAEFFERAALSGDDAPRDRREAERVLEFCTRVQRAAPLVAASSPPGARFRKLGPAGLSPCSGCGAVNVGAEDRR